MKVSTLFGWMALILAALSGHVSADLIPGGPWLSFVSPMFLRVILGIGALLAVGASYLAFREESSDQKQIRNNARRSR